MMSLKWVAAEQSASADAGPFIGFPSILLSRPPLLSFGVLRQKSASADSPSVVIVYGPHTIGCAAVQTSQPRKGVLQ
jgi:hypothetical protein